MSDAPLPPPATPIQFARAPRSGELSPGWRVVTAVLWGSVMLALAAVWNTSVQLGLSTWWLGPRGDPQPLLVQISVFVGPLLMLVGALSRVRWLGWFGLAVGALIVAYGAVDLGRFTGLGVLQVLIGIGAGAVSVASLTGTYRPIDDVPIDVADGVPIDVADGVPIDVADDVAR